MKIELHAYGAVKKEGVTYLLQSDSLVEGFIKVYSLLKADPSTYFTKEYKQMGFSAEECLLDKIDETINEMNIGKLSDIVSHGYFGPSLSSAKYLNANATLMSIYTTLQGNVNCLTPLTSDEANKYSRAISYALGDMLFALSRTIYDPIDARQFLELDETCTFSHDLQIFFSSKHVTPEEYAAHICELRTKFISVIPLFEDDPEKWEMITANLPDSVVDTLNPNLGVVDLDGGRGFVIADIPGLIEGASEGVGLGHEFLRHIERTKVIIHMVDAASTEGRDPVADIKAINEELRAYNPELLKRPQVIAANKIDAIYTDDETENPVDVIKKAFEPEGIKVYPISAVTGQGLKELLYYVRELLDSMTDEPVMFEKELDTDTLFDNPNEAFYVEKDDKGVYVVSGPRIDRMLGYTNLESEKGFNFFQKFLRQTGILKQLKELGVQEGDTVRVGDYLEFDYYD